MDSVPLTTLLTALLGLMAVLHAVRALYPRLGWELSKWRYRDPEAVEPSRAVFRLRRAASLVLFAVFLTAALLVRSLD